MADTHVICISGRLPGLNEMIGAAKGTGGRGARYSKMKRDWTEVCALLAKARHIPRMARVFLEFKWTEPAPSKHARTRDPDNVAAGRKFILDGLVNAGVIDDDNLAHVAGWRDSFAVGGSPGVEVTITEAA